MSSPKPEGDNNQGDDSKKAEGGCCSCCCCACCKGEEDKIPKHLKDGDITSDRSCTDCPMIIIYTLFVIGWIIILGVAADNGKPDRILLPENFRGDLCGDGRLAQYNTMWVPLPSRPSYGICTKGCPAVGAIICNNDLETNLEPNTTGKVPNHEYSSSASEYTSGLAANAQCKASSCDAATQRQANRFTILQIKMAEKKCFWSYYPSKPNLNRCIPSLSGDSASQKNATIENLANQTAESLKTLSSTLGVGSFFSLGFAEIEQAWLVILISALICMVIAVIWVVLLRWILAPIVYAVVILILGVFIALGFIFMYFADDLEQNSLPGESGTDNQVTLWRAAQYASFLIAAMYLIIMLYMLKRIRIAIAVMEEASKAFMAAPSMILVPIITFFVLIGWIAFFIVSAVYIQTMGGITNEQIANQAGSLFGGEAKNLTELFLGSSLNSSGITVGSSDPTFNVSKWTTEDATKALHAYNFFAVLWTGNFCMMLGFFVMAMTVCGWYFSATQLQMQKAEDGATEEEGGKAKQVPVGGVGKALVATICNHIGTVLWGALLIAIIQFVRAVFTYLQENYLKDFEQSTAGAIILKCVQCCLWYIEHVVRVISKNAFIICIIRCTNFCSSAAEALSAIVSNAARISILSMLSTATMFLVKIFIVGANILIAYGLLGAEALTKDKKMDSGLFPLFLIAIMSFAIATLFLNVYEACIDTIFLSFIMDEKYFEGEFMPPSLAKLTNLFKDAEEAREKYEKQMSSAMKANQNAEAGKA